MKNNKLPTMRINTVLRSAALLFCFALIVLACDNDDEGGGIDGSELQVTSVMEIQHNPSGLAPLTAYLNFETSKEANVSIKINGENPLTKFFRNEATEHQVPIIGLYPGIVNEVDVFISDDNGNTISETVEIETPELPIYFPDIEIVEKKTALMEPGWSMMTYQVGLGEGQGFFAAPFVFDESGMVRWYLDIREVIQEGTAPLELLQNGNIFFGNGNSIMEYNFMGFKENQWDMPVNYAFHHDVIEKPNGNFIVAVDDHNLSTIEDIAIELDRTSGEVINRWDLREILDVDRNVFVNDNVDWFHMNSVWYDEEDDAVIFSGRNQGAVKVTANNDLIWILGKNLGWGQAGVNGDGLNTADYLFTAVDQDGVPYPEGVQNGTVVIDEFEWNYGQHAVMKLENGNIFLFDNGFGRNPNAGLYSRGVEYKINEDDMTVQQVWQYGKERGAEFQSIIISDVDVMATTGNRVIFSGINFDNRNSQIIEVTYPNSEVVFEAKINYKNTFASPNGPPTQATLEASYRSERVSVYSGY
ncbi:aryl-sulfate sulfotransferase [Roseivirga pacifica]|uniref:aryl-sulfate sulfotransferase n=1 Tax=Roseivirga pacifica TaxID=1267423 RepID=UPI00227BE4E5|nr:aryl-sulfate sulfotransferase [Roseivirga pacifica]